MGYLALIILSFFGLASILDSVVGSDIKLRHIIICILVYVVIVIDLDHSNEARNSRIREEGYHEGFEEGYIKGDEEGYNNWYNYGYDEGYSKGYEEGLIEQ